MRRHPQLLHLCHLRPAAAIAARCWHHHASLSHEPRGHSHCRARPAWPNRHLVGAHRGHPQPQPDRCACVQCGRWWLGRAAGSRPCAGDVACHGWPVLWRQSSRSAPRPWLRGCLQAAPRDPGSGVRCVYRSSYGYTRVYWSQLPAVGAFGRVWWPWRTMRTQKVAFLNYRGSLRFRTSLLSFLLAGLLPLQQAAELNCLNESERVLAARLTGHRTPDRTGQYAHGISNDKNSWIIPRASHPKTSGASLPA